MHNLFSIMRDHVTLSTACIDRIYLSGYLPRLQTPGQLAYFLGKHLGNRIVSPALFPPLRRRFTESVDRFAHKHGIPIVDFKQLKKSGERKDEAAARYRARFEKPVGVVFVGVAQEKMFSFKSHKRPDTLTFDFLRQSTFVNHYYFYVQDRQWGPGFVKIGSYVPYPVKVCLNGHEWVKQQLRHEGIAFEALDNGFRWCEAPEQLQAICDRLASEDVQSFFERWSDWLPWPLPSTDRAEGYQHQLSIWQLEVSFTQVFDQPVQGRHFFEEVIRDNLDLGRPDRVSLIFPIRHTRRTRPPKSTSRLRSHSRDDDPQRHDCGATVVTMTLNVTATDRQVVTMPDAVVPPLVISEPLDDHHASITGPGSVFRSASCPRQLARQPCRRGSGRAAP